MGYDFSNSPEIGTCTPPFSRSAVLNFCELSRTSFGGLQIRSGGVVLNAAGRIRSISSITLDGSDFDLARRLLEERFGAGGIVYRHYEWRNFDDGALIFLVRLPEGDSHVMFQFPANDEDTRELHPEF